MFKKRIDMSDFLSIQPTSVIDLKNQCLIKAKGDLAMAKELYAFFSEGVEGLPLVDPPKPTNMDKVKSVVGDIVGWTRENQDGLVQAISVAKNLFGKGGGMPLQNVENVAPTMPPPLDPIN